MIYFSDKCSYDKIIELENTAWPSDKDPIFPSAPNTYVSSLVILDDDLAVSHVAILRTTLNHKGNIYLAYGLSEVVTHPDYKGKGLASQLILKARDIMGENLIIFTCAKDLVPFYEKQGFTSLVGTCFVGGSKEKPFRSDSLGLVVMIDHADLDDFSDCDVVFDFEESQLW